MSEIQHPRGGRHKDYSPLPMDNPEIPSKGDWWDDLCKAHGAKNVWKKTPKLNKVRISPKKKKNK